MSKRRRFVKFAEAIGVFSDLFLALGIVLMFAGVEDPFAMASRMFVAMVAIVGFDTLVFLGIVTG